MEGRKQVVLVVMDGVGFSTTGIGDAVTTANTPVLDELLKKCPNTRLKAHGTAVGLANVAPTIATVFGLKAPECWESSMI